MEVYIMIIKNLLGHLGNTNSIKTLSLNSASIPRYNFFSFLVGVATITCFYNLILFIKRRKESYPLYISFICLSIIGWVLLWAFNSSPTFFSLVQNRLIKIIYLTVLFSPVGLFMLYLSALYNNLLHPISLIISKYALLIYAVLLALLPDRLQFISIIFYQIISLLVMFYALYKLFKLCVKDIKNYYIIFISSVILVIMLAFAIVYYYISNIFQYILGLLCLTFLMLQNYLIAERSAKSFNEIERISEKLSHNNSLKDDLLTCIYEDLKPPMCSIVSLTESVINDKNKLSSNQLLDITLINYSALQLSNLIDDILDYSKLNSKDVILERRPVNLKQLVDMVILITMGSLNNRKVIFKNNLQAHMPEIIGDINRLQQILNSLLELTLAYINDGIVSINSTIENNMAVITIEDNGVGIPPWKLTKLFKKYSPSPNEEDSSANLRLNVAEKLIKLHGGTIDIKSTIGVGTSIQFTLPIVDENIKLSNKDIHSTFKELASDYEPMDFNMPEIRLKKHDYKILIVDSDEAGSKVICNLLTAEGCFVASVKSGIRALELIDATPDLDLIITNIFIEGMIGYDLCKSIRERKTLYELPIIMLTSNINSRSLDLIFESGGNDFLLKPVDKLSLLAKVKTLLQLKHYALESSELQNQISFTTKKVADLTEDINRVKEIDKLKTEFFANISHELKTPLNVIWASVQLLKELLPKNKEDELNIHNYLRVMNQNCLRLIHLITNLIDITKIDGNYMHLELSNNDIVYTIEEIVQSVVDYARTHDIAIVFDTNIEEKITAFDPDKIERIILNLLSNAIKFTPRGGSIYVTLEDLQSFIRIIVKDTGIGIPKDKLNLIFERFTQVDKSLSRKREGSGIGLSLVKSLVELHGATISVESEPSMGSTFIIDLPYTILEGGDISESSYHLLPSSNKIDKINLEFSDIYNW